jgi:hypothetical protein
MRVLPARKGVRRALLTVIVLAVMAVLWFWVFPWADRTFVNRPAIEEGLRQRAAITSVPTASL